MPKPSLVSFDQRYIQANSRPNADGCWIWRSVDRNGYALAAGGESSAYRLAYRIWKGPIPEDAEIDHTCHDPKICVPPCLHRACVNPDHLEAMTRRKNARKSGNPFGLNAQKTHCKRGHEFTEENTIRTSRDSRRCRTCHYAQTRAAKRRSRAKERESGDQAADVLFSLEVAS